MSGDNILPIASRSEFTGAIRASFALAAQDGANEIVIVDPNFADWPLNDRAVVDSLVAWVDSRRSLTVFADSFEEIARRQSRFVEWRRQWAHVVRCRSDPELETEQVPTILLAPGVTCVRLLDRVRYRGTVSNRAVDMTECQETIDALLQRSAEAFPVTTLGL
ncbi:MAG TPA: hypothetical protein VGI48_19480 [Caldimonas sp.]|jgi:hypothetical protein